ncbi:hypothetical protein AUJ73_01765 [Candidatus Gottesmanbacteria bacterium CG1_02_37_22]|uniref:Erythromycin biosynthesis sensory transduction protein eryC1 n=3 Tax=Candidatus Gottesmaniibacteriota TaxID=1752720 RepID=A0A1J4TU51_9BACT|nr:MAG: hypothetical protein AUJ73_01765 [Candidatus Gottesmanbacteria bacterium CG1_02_37_22]
MIPTFTLNRQNKILRKELDEAIEKVIESGIFILGPEVEKFEKEFAKYIGVKYAVGVASGTDAISLALLSIGVGQDDEVILPANAYPSVFALSAIGAVPRLVDIDPHTYNIDHTKIEKVISKKTKAILPVHLYGQPAQIDEIIRIGSKHGLTVVEDCAQAHGALCRVREGVYRKAGSFGRLSCFSFYPTKNLGCFGDGGMLVTDDPDIYAKLKLLRMYGEEERYKSVILGRNSRLDELQAAILRMKLKYLDAWNKRRREIAEIYFHNLDNLEGLVINKEKDDVKHIYHLFTIMTEKRDELKNFLLKRGIQTAIHYPSSIHLESSYKFLGYGKGVFPESEKVSREILSLPMYPELTDKEVIKICKEIKAFFRIH